MTPPCRFLTKKRYSVPHQSSQLTEDTEVGGEKRKGRKREGGTVRGNRVGKMFEVTQKAKREVTEIKDIAQSERDEETEGEDRHYHMKSILLKEGYMVKSHNSEDKPVFCISFYCTYLAIISFSLLEECPPLPKTFAGVERKYRQWFLKY